MNSPDSQSPLDDFRTTQHIRRLWKAWMAGEQSILDRILTDDPSIANDTEALADLVYSEYWLRKQIDSSVTESEYLSRFPAIANELRDQFAVASELFDLDSRSRSARESEPIISIDTSRDYKSMVPMGFVPLSLLGVGGMGVVVRARQESLHRDVAIKTLKAGAWVTDAERELFLKEAHVVGQLKHPNIVQIYDVIEEDRKLFLVMEYVSGKSLAQIIADAPLNPRDAAKCIWSINSAIHAAHQAGFLHRDIKPSNILIAESGEIKVADFGLARAMSGPNMSITGELLGTMAYMAPEQAAGKRNEIGFQTDVYGIGATLYEILTRRPPFIGNSPAETLMQIVHATAKPVRDVNPVVPRDLESICHRCIEKSPRQRYQTVDQLQRDVERFLAGKPTHARPLSHFERTTRWVRANSVLFYSALAVCMATMALLATTTWYLTQLASLESVGQSRELALSEARRSSQLDKYYALASRIQASVSEQKIGWTWDVQNAIREAMQYSPTNSEKLMLRNALCKTLQGFDLRMNSVIQRDLDPFGLAWSSDGRLLAIGENIVKKGLDETDSHGVHILGDWPNRELQEIRFPIAAPIDSSNGFVEGIRSLVFLDDNKSLVVGCRSGWIQILDVTTGQVITKWRAHADWCYALAYDPVRSWLVSGSRDGSIYVWDSKDYQEIRSLAASGSVSNLAVLNDRIVALGKYQERFVLPTFERFDETQKEPHNFNYLRDFNDGKSLLLASGQKIMFVDSDFNSSREFSLRRSPFTKSDNIRHIDVSATGDVVSVSSNENVVFLDNVGKLELRSVPTPGMGNKYVTFDRKGGSIWLTNNYELLRYDWRQPEVWTFSMKAEKQTKRIVSAHEVAEFSPSFLSIGESVLVRPVVNGTKHLWHKILVNNVPANKTLIESLFEAIGANDKNLMPLDQSLFSGSSVWNSTDHTLTNYPTALNQSSTNLETAFCLSNDGHHYWTADKNISIQDGLSVGRLRVLRMSDGGTIFEWENLESEKALRLSRIEQIVCGDDVTLTISVDRKLRVYDTKTIRLIQELELGPGSTPKRVAMNPRETNAYIGTQEGRVLGVDLNSKATVKVLEQSAEITAITISSDGVLAVGNPEGEIDLWSIVEWSEPKQLCRLATMPNTIKSLEFSRDDKKLAVYVEGDSAARILNMTEFRSRLHSFDLDW